MESGYFKNCGNFSNDLEEISNDLIKNKQEAENGIDKQEKEYIYSEVFNAYQLILKNFNDKNEIASTLKNMKMQFENGSTSLNEVLEESVKITKIEKYNKVANDINENGVDSNNVTAIAMCEVIEKEAMNIFNGEMLKTIDLDIILAQKGDVNSAASVELIEKAGYFLLTHDKLDEKTERGALAWMERLADVGTESAKKMLSEMSKKYNMNLDFSNFEDGKAKLDELYKAKISVVNPNMAQKAGSYFKELDENLGSSNIANHKYDSYTASKVSSQTKRKAIMYEIRQALKNGEDISVFSKKYPEEVKDVMKEMIQNINSVANSANRMYGYVQQMSDSLKENEKDNRRNSDDCERL